MNTVSFVGDHNFQWIKTQKKKLCSHGSAHKKPTPQLKMMGISKPDFLEVNHSEPMTDIEHKESLNQHPIT